MFRVIPEAALAASLVAAAVLLHAAEFEEPAVPALSELLPAELRRSVHHSVEDVRIDGRFYSFSLDSEFGTYAVPSLALLRIRVREIETLSQAVNQFAPEEDQSRDEMRGQYSVSADSALDILTHPVSTAGDLAGQVAGNLNETFTGVAPGTAPGSTQRPEDGGGNDTVLEMHRRNAAAQWGLDPYSSNARVQEFLDNVARARSAGRISAGTPTFLASTQRRLSVEDPVIDAGVAAELKTRNAAELRTEGAATLARIQVRADLVGRFTNHASYSPRHLVRICRYLEALEGVLNRSAFIEAALNAGDERMVLAFEEAAMMLVFYHRNVERLRKLHAGPAFLEALTVGNRIVYIAPVDLVYWSRSVAELFDQQLSRDRAAGLKGWEIVAAGTVTPTAARELGLRDYTVRDRFVR
jgi:hypothetical protein